MDVLHRQISLHQKKNILGEAAMIRQQKCQQIGL